MRNRISAAPAIPKACGFEAATPPPKAGYSFSELGCPSSLLCVLAGLPKQRQEERSCPGHVLISRMHHIFYTQAHYCGV